MAHHVRLRRVVKWSGGIMCGLTAATFAVSLVWAVYLSGPYCRAGIAVQPGIVYVEWSDPARVESFRKRNLFPSGSLDVERYGRQSNWTWYWWPRSDDNSRNWHYVSLPLWIPFVAFGVPVAVLMWQDRRRVRPGQCPRCGYDLRGNVSGRCPECGTPTSRSASTPGTGHG